MDRVVGVGSAQPISEWEPLKDRVLEASIGVKADLAKVLDRIDPSGPATAYPWTHAETMTQVALHGAKVALEPANLSLGRLKDDPGTTTAVAAYTCVDTREVLGYTVHWLDHGRRISDRQYVMFRLGDARTKGVGSQATMAWDTLTIRLGLASMTTEAAYVGRLFWALEGFDFASEAVRAEVKERFARFMERFGLAADDLYFRREDGTREPFSFERLHHAWDYAYVASTKGPIRLPVRSSDVGEDEGELDPGRAFLLGDFRKIELADCVCPHYLANRPSAPGSPGQAQAKRYAAYKKARGA